MSKSMTIYTVSYTHESETVPLTHCVVGSYMTRGEALDACVDYIMKQIEDSEELASSVAFDENHPSVCSWMWETKEGWTVDDPVALRNDIRDELGGQGGYYIYDGTDTWHFDVDENDLFGVGSEVEK